MNPKTDFFFAKENQWQDAVAKLRNIVLDCGLTEELKWGQPAYTFEGANIVLIHTFKEYCALLFFKGALLKDPEGILVQQTQNVQSARQLRFTDAKQIGKLVRTIKEYVYEAIEADKAGLKVPLKKTTEFPVPEEFKQVLKQKPALKKAFAELTPGRQRAWLLHFAAPKQSATREARIEKAISAILTGKGLNER